MIIIFQMPFVVVMHRFDDMINLIDACTVEIQCFALLLSLLSFILVIKNTIYFVKKRSRQVLLLI